jgi:hypothetical protein
MKLNRVKMFARKISATDRLVRSPPALASPRERRSATWALVRPAAGVSAIAAPVASGVEATASAMPGHRAAVKGQPNARPRPALPERSRDCRSCVEAGGQVQDHRPASCAADQPGAVGAFDQGARCRRPGRGHGRADAAI